jgi:GTP-binding protein
MGTQKALERGGWRNGSIVAGRGSGSAKRLVTESLRRYVARSKKYEPKYAVSEAKRAIEPSRVLDPSKERKMASSRLQELAFDEQELGSAVFESFDVDLNERELDPETMSDAELEKVIEAQAKREARISSKHRSLPSSTPPHTTPDHNAQSKKNRIHDSSIIPSHKRKNERSDTKLDSQAQEAHLTHETDTQTPGGVYRKALIAIVGRPNVGKSTLFNRLIRKSKSLITPKAGTTRDRKYGFTIWEDYEMMFVDTGGLMGDDEAMETVYEAGSSEARVVVSNWKASIKEQAEIAIEESDLIVFMTDYQEKGVVDPHDVILARLLRKTSKPVVLVVNKCDNDDRMSNEGVLARYERLGLGKVWAISASHGHGVGELLDGLVEPLVSLGFKTKTERLNRGLASGLNGEEEANFALTEDKLVLSSAFHEDGSRKEIRVALVGVPNVGKSSLLNSIMGAKRAVVSPTPGTTTDPVDEKILWQNSYPIVMVDTAGVRRKKQQEGFVEKLSALWSLKVIEASHVSILLIDAANGVQAQDVRLSSYIMENFRSCIVVINKWDLAPDRSIIGMQAYEEQLRERLHFWYYVPVVFASAMTGFNVDAIMAWVVRVADERRIHLATRKLFQILEQASLVKSTPSKGHKKLKFRFATQVNLGGGPTFIFFVNHPSLIDPPYSRFLEGFIRQNYAFTGTPIRLMFRQNASRTITDRDRKNRQKNLQQAENDDSS